MLERYIILCYDKFCLASTPIRILCQQNSQAVFFLYCMAQFNWSFTPHLWLWPCKPHLNHIRIHQCLGYRTTDSTTEYYPCNNHIFSSSTNNMPKVFGGVDDYWRLQHMAQVQLLNFELCNNVPTGPPNRWAQH